MAHFFVQFQEGLKLWLYGLETLHVVPKAIGKVMETGLTIFTQGRYAKLRRLLALSAEGVSSGEWNAQLFVRGRGVFGSMLVALALILSSPVGPTAAAFAQAQTAGEITGQVLDPSKAAISNAPVTATNSATGVVRKVQTDSQGHYALTDLPVRTYSITVEHEGFQQLVLEAREAALEMAKDATRAAHIIDRVHSLYRKAPSQMDSVDVNELIEEMVLFLHNEANRHSVSMRTDVAGGIPRVMADRVQLQQVLMNLMLNGIQAMEQTGGVLTINAQLDPHGRVLIAVSDTGVGFPPEKAEQIFDAFFTKKPEGSGMGLAISRSIVESHGGRIWATANSRRGATFHFTLSSGLAGAA
jgi:signal transduction histidine kinase